MKTKLYGVITALLLCPSLWNSVEAGCIYDEFENTSKITWIGNYKVLGGGTADWAKRQGDVYRLALENKSSYAYMVYELPAGNIVRRIVVDFYSPQGYKPTLAVKNVSGHETKYVKGWDTGYPTETVSGDNCSRFVLDDALIPDDATQVVIYLDADSDVELMRVIADYGEDGYILPEYNTNADYSRIKRLMAKAAAGQNLTIGVIGGSMTAGANAEPMATNCYGARLKKWFETQYGIEVTLVNAGIGSTNSYFGAIRAEEHLLRHNPDLIVQEYAVNDQDDNVYLDFYEGLMRKLLKSPKHPAVISLMLCTQAGITKSDRQYPIAQHYNVPVVSYSDVIKKEIMEGLKSWKDYYATLTLAGGDGIHPNTAAHQKIADLLAAELLKAAPDGSAEVTTILPQPKYSNMLEDVFYLSYTDIVPKKTGEWIDGGSIWNFNTGKGCRSNKAGSELVFDITGDVAAVTYWKRPAGENFGRAEIWVDDMPRTTVDGSNGEHIDQIVLTGLGAGKHLLHIRLSDDKSFEVVCIAVSGERDFWNGDYALQSVASNMQVKVGDNDLSYALTGTKFDVSHTADGYLMFAADGRNLTVDAGTGLLTLSSETTGYAKFLFVDKGAKFALRCVATGLYLSWQDGALGAMAATAGENEFFILNKNTEISLNAMPAETAPEIFSYNGILYVLNAPNRRLQVFSAVGRSLVDKTLTSENETVALEKGVYVVAAGGDVQKVVIR